MNSIPKKFYEAPAMEIVVMETESVLAGSDGQATFENYHKNDQDSW